MAKTTTRQKGAVGEEIAADFLIKKGYRIVDRNYTIRGGEIDLIAIDADMLVFIEVKIRSGNQFGLPEDAINWYKIRHIIQAGTLYSLRHPKLPQGLRVDAVAIELDSKYRVHKIRHHIDISS